jgi:hypothetical protein
MKSVISAALAATMLAVATPAAADWIDDRQERQIERIRDGWRSGQLTRDEYQRLVDQQREIARLERILERDGRLSYSDRMRLTALQDAASRAIFWEKHDGQTRANDRGWDRDWGWRYGWGREWGGWGRGWDRYGDGYGRDHGPDRNTWHRRWWAWN